MNQTVDMPNRSEADILKQEVNRLNFLLRQSEDMVEEYRLNCLEAEKKAVQAKKEGQKSKTAFKKSKSKYADLRKRYDELSKAVTEQPIFPDPAEIPKNYRGWTVQKRGQNRAGELIFNMVKRVKDQQIWKYIGKWDQSKADKIIDASEKDRLGKGSDK